MDTQFELPSFKDLLKGAQLPSNDMGMVPGGWQLPCRVDAPFVGTSTQQYNTPTAPRPAPNVLTWSSFEHRSARKTSRDEDSDISETRQCALCQCQGCSDDMLSSGDHAAQNGLRNNHRSPSDRAFTANENKRRSRARASPEDNYTSGKNRRCMSRYDVHCSGGSSSTKTESSASSDALKAEPSSQCTLSRDSTLTTDHSDVDQVIQQKVEGKIAHKKAEKRRRNEQSTLITEMEHCLPPEFLDGCRPKNQRPGFTKNRTLKAMLKYHKHQATVIDEQLGVIEAQAAAIAELEDKITALMQQVRQCGTWNKPRC